MSLNLLENATEQIDLLRGLIAQSASMLRDFSRRMELILSQDHKNISVRDVEFSEHFSSFCTELRKKLDEYMDFWRQTRMELRCASWEQDYDLSLSAKSFSLRAKTLSRATDDFTTAYDEFNRFYKKYTLAKLPVWVLTSCCDDINNFTGKILFLAREISKKTEKRSCL